MPDLELIPKALRPYFDSQGNQYIKPRNTGWCVMPVLEFLNGRQLTRMAFNWLLAVKPTWVRIVRYGQPMTCDAVTNRVTIHLKEDGVTIDRIEQEVNVGLEGVEHGADLRAKTGI
jgi:hypothetical protein